MSIQDKEVLVVDDVADVRTRCRKVLETLGMKVYEAVSVTQAIDMLASKLPHLIILDLHMPGKSGFDFLAARATAPRIAAVPVVILSAAGDRDSVDKAIALGADDYVLKPLNAALVSQRVRKHVRGLEFLRRSFGADQAPAVTLHVGGQITRVDATSLTLESPVRLERGTRISLSPSVLAGDDGARYPLVTDSEPGRRGISGRYVTRVNVVGLEETIHRKIGRGSGKPKP